MSLLQRHLYGKGPEASSSSSLKYVACHLSRHDLLQRHAWGLWISFGQDEGSAGRTLVVGALHPTFENLLQWAWVTSSPPETSILTNQAYGCNLWKGYFAMLPQITDISPRTLIPGDIILTINGMPIDSFGDSLTNVTDYLQRCNELFLVAVRKGTASLLDPNLQLVLEKAHQMAGQSLASYSPPLHAQSWNPFAPPIGFGSCLPPQCFPQSIHRVVTPSKTETGSLTKSPSKLVHKAACTKPVLAQRSLQLEVYTGKNPMFHKTTKHDNKSQSSLSDDHIPFADNDDVYDPEEGKRRKEYMLPIDSINLQPWLHNRKQKWRSKWNIKANISTGKAIDIIDSLNFSMPAQWTNPMFQDTSNSDNDNDNTANDDNINSNTASAEIPYCDNYTFDPYDGSRSGKFIFPVSLWNFQVWLNHRKWKWRSRWKITTIKDQLDIDLQWALTGMWTNPMFAALSKEEDKGNDDDTENNRPGLPYDDNFLHEEESSDFFTSVTTSDWSTWLKDRKEKWRTNWKPYQIQVDEEEFACQHSMVERLESTIRYDFWVDRYPSFDGWLKASKDKWNKSYSWNSRKRKRIQQVCEEIVQFPSSQDPVVAQEQLHSWLRVRKNQWRMLRRKRQRRWEEEATLKEIENTDADATLAATATCVQTQHCMDKHATAISGDYLHIDALLEEEERKKKTLAEQRKCRQPIDISFLFLPSFGLSDDVAAHCVQYLDCSEHGKLLCINKSFGEGLKSRAYMWQLLCRRCPHWHLPRRPRKPWYKLYLSKLRTEEFASRKQWDDLLTNISEVLLKGDQLKLVKKLIEAAEKKFSFTVDYVSGVVCERNGILNLAVIHKRHKVVHWLIEQKNADIETSDRGHFTPLINAAWGGDKHLVRFLLHHGADRSKVGTGHYTEALAPSDFKGLTAEGWAGKKGHSEIAELIRVGL